ncbi:restriction endonuclease subunit S [Campylobacter jejuni]|nr:restriction endonuclease subunit S [Campylobacter jejuni]ECK9954964.1 restriction endonuclease subunit S [Campylobacter jejuni]EDO9850603.1 restriction endonuclease subunit S [Campylobacter jejuni]
MTNLPQGWKWKSLGEICFITDGTHKTPNYIETGIPFLSVKNISKGFFDLSDVKYISLEEHNKLIKRAKPEFGDILICRIGTLGKAIKISLEFEFSIFVSLGLLKPKVKIISDYLVYFLNSCFIEEWINDNKVGGGTHTAKLNLNILEKCPIALPPLKKQERIVGILDESFVKIDESIKILEQNLLNLDELMQSALQKAFNPLKDNAKENYKLPQGWEWKSLGEIGNTSSGGTPLRNKKEYWENGSIKWLKSGELNDGYIDFIEENITEEAIENSSAKIFQKGTLLIAMYGATAGRLGILNLDSATNQAVCAFLHKDNKNIKFLEKFLFYFLFFIRDKIIKDSFGGAQPNISQTYIKNLQIPLPPLKEQEQIAKHLDFIFEKTKALKELYTKELKDYEELKQSLLDKAFKGEL